MKIGFAGTDTFSLDVLEPFFKGISCDVTLDIILTQPAKKKGRGNKRVDSDVFKFAKQKNIDVFAFSNFKELTENQKKRLKYLDYIVVVSFGLIFTNEILSLPKYGCVNIHPSLLPRWRGAAPIQRAIEAGDLESGVCLMKMETGLDTGPVWRDLKVEIKSNDTSYSLQNKLSKASVNLLLLFFDKKTSTNDRKKFINQSKIGITYAKKIRPEEGRVNWRESSKIISDKARAFFPKPCLYSFIQGTRIKIGSVKLINEKDLNKYPGKFISVPKNKNQENLLKVSCGRGLIGIEKLQKAGGNWVDPKTFFNGFQLNNTDSFELK